MSRIGGAARTLLWKPHAETSQLKALGAPVASKPFCEVSLRQRRTSWAERSWIAAGELRSANRASWTAAEKAEAPGWHAINTNDKGSNGEDAPSDTKKARRQGVWEAAESLQDTFAAIDRLVCANLLRVQQAFAAAQVGPHHFAGSTGYGHGDLGRAALDEIMANIMGTDTAIVRSNFVSGTHAIATALFACLRPGDELIAVAGRPYDTLEEVIGLRGAAGRGSLRDWGISYQEIALQEDGRLDMAAFDKAFQGPGRKVALIQRSCGYALRPTLEIEEIGEAIQAIKGSAPGCKVVVDNCYGEFTESREPGAVGADLVMGSLIKSPGGTIVSGGGYVAGRRELVAAANARLTAPGVGLDSGCVSGESLRLIFQGLFLAPQMVGEALKGGRLLAEVFSRRGMTVYPPPHPSQHLKPVASFITAIQLGSPQAMQTFCRAVQRKSPVGSYVIPIPGQTAGYGDKVIFADGTFVDGSTAELSADGPLREPYVAYCQGGTHWTHWAICLEEILQCLDMEDLLEVPNEPSSAQHVAEITGSMKGDFA